MFETVLADWAQENQGIMVLVIVAISTYLRANWQKIEVAMGKAFSRFQDTKAQTDTYSYELARDQQESRQREKDDTRQQILDENKLYSGWMRDSVDKRLDSIESASNKAADTSLSTYTQQDIMGRRIQVIETEVKTHRELLRALETGQNELKEGHGRIESMLNVQTYYQELAEGSNAKNPDD